MGAGELRGFWSQQWTLCLSDDVCLELYDCGDFAEHSDREILFEFQKLGLKVSRLPHPGLRARLISCLCVIVHILRKI